MRWDIPPQRIWNSHIILQFFMTVLLKFQIEISFSIELHGNSKLLMTSCPPSSATKLDPLTENAIHCIESGNKEAREGTATFLIQHSSERSHFLFSNTVCVLRSRSTPRTWCLSRCCHGEAYLGASISVPCATDRSIGLPELRHCKRHFQTDPDV